MPVQVTMYGKRGEFVCRKCATEFPCRHVCVESVGEDVKMRL